MSENIIDAAFKRVEERREAQVQQDAPKKPDTALETFRKSVKVEGGKDE